MSVLRAQYGDLVAVRPVVGQGNQLTGLTVEVRVDYIDDNATIITSVNREYDVWAGFTDDQKAFMQGIHDSLSAQIQADL